MRMRFSDLFDWYYWMRGRTMPNFHADEGPVLDGDPAVDDFSLTMGFILAPGIAILSLIYLFLDLQVGLILGGVAILIAIISRALWFNSEVVAPDQFVARKNYHERIFQNGRYFRLGTRTLLFRFDTANFRFNVTNVRGKDALIVTHMWLTKAGARALDDVPADNDEIQFGKTQKVGFGVEVEAGLDASRPRTILRSFRTALKKGPGDAMQVIREDILNRLTDVANEVMGTCWIEEGTSKRAEFNTRLTDGLREIMLPLGVHIFKVVVEEELHDVDGAYFKSRDAKNAAESESKAAISIATSRTEKEVANAQSDKDIGLERIGRDIALTEKQEALQAQQEKTNAAKERALLQNIVVLMEHGLSLEMAQVVSSIRSMNATQIADVTKQIAAAAGNPGALASGSLTLVDGNSEQGGSNALMALLKTALATYQQQNGGPD